MNEYRRARIRWKHLPSGKTGIYDEPIGTATLSPEDDHDSFMWLEGNFSCDCNRRIIFLGEDADKVECGEGAFEISIDPVTIEDSSQLAKQ